MKQKLLLVISVLLMNGYAIAQSDCTSAILVCGNTQSYNPSGVGSKLESLACGGIEHNSIWIAFQAKANGKLNFIIRPTTPAGLPATSDFDWSLWKLDGAPGSGNCSNKTQLSCNFAGVGTVFGIPGATGMATPNFAATQFNPGIDVTSGTWYTLIIDQFSNTTPMLFSVQFTGNTESPHLNSTPGIFDNRPDFSVNSSCNGSFSFTSTAVSVNGISSYSWNFGDGSTSTEANPSHSYVTNGTYYVTLTITDNNGCQSTIRKAVVYNNTVPVVTTAGILVTPACSDANNGTITVNTAGATTPGITGGTPPYTFETVSPSPMIRASQSSNVFTGLQPGTYTIKVTDACGKSATGTATISQIASNTLIGLGIQNIQSACGSSASGTATIFVNGTVPPYTMRLVNSSPVTSALQTAVIRDPVTATYYCTFTGLLPGSYTVEATDACNRIRRATFTVTASTAPQANSFANPSCAGTATGSIQVSATAATGLSGSGSPGTYQYALISPSVITRPFQNSSVFEALVPGAYTVAVRDNCGNIGTSTVNVASAPAPTFSTSFTTLTCPNGSTGSIEAQINTVGGGSPFTYELIAPSMVTRPAQGSNLFSGLPAGSYTIRLTDGCGTRATTTATVSAATAPSFTTTTGSSCLTPASGTITVTPAATNIGPFSFELISPGAAIRAPQVSNIANTNNSLFAGLNQGSYTIRMTDGCNVPVTAVATISAPTALTFPAGTAVTPSCGSSATGRITVAQPGTGLGAYRYELIAPSPVTRSAQYSRIFDNLPVGDYTIRITDSCGTQITNSGSPVTIGTASAPTLTVTNSASCATNTGTITCLATAGNQGGGTYTFSLIAPSPVTQPEQASPFFSGLPAGVYTVQVKDQCGQTGTTTTTIAAAGAFTPAAGGSVVSCSGTGYIGQIIVTTPQNFTASGPIPTGSGGGPYTYAVYDASNTTLIAGPQSSNIFSTITPLAGATTHTIRVTDACGNTSTSTLALNPPNALSAAVITAFVASCASEATGVIRVSTVSAGGLTPYSYTLLDAVTSNVVAGPQTSIIFNNVPANATGYLVRTTDACGNTATSSTPLLFAAAATPTGTLAITPSCASSPTGKIIVTPGTGATLAGGTFSYALYDETNTTQVAATQASPVFTDVAAGNYTVRITDRCGTTGTIAASVGSTITALTATGTATNTCSGSSNGSITAGSTGGSLPIVFTLLNQPGGTIVAGPQSSNIFTGLAAGTYVVRATDACGTTANSADIILGTLSALPTLTTSVALDCSGFATLGAFGASGNGGSYTYAICSGSGCTNYGSFSGNSLFNITTDGIYRIVVKDRCGNETVSSDISITIPLKPSITGVTKANATGSTSITASFTNVPNTPYYSVDGANFSPVLPTVEPGCHTIRVTDYNAGVFGCASDSYTFSVYGAPVLKSASPDNWVVNCGMAQVTPVLEPGTGITGCTGSGASVGVKLTACTGCNATADPVGTAKAAGVSFYLPGATAVSFQPVIMSGGSALDGGGTVVSANFKAPPFICFTLPAELVSFTGKRTGKNNTLSWVTATEHRVSGFRIQYAEDGLNFSDIGFVQSSAAGGESNTRLSYSFIHQQPSGNIQYYRLLITDFDGTNKTSNTIQIKESRTDAIVLSSITPNPASTQVSLHIESAAREKMTLLVLNTSGKVVIRKEILLETGVNTIPVNIHALPGGLYMTRLVCSDNCRTLVSQFVKQ